jgi:TonB-dependent receptor
MTVKYITVISFSPCLLCHCALSFAGNNDAGTGKRIADELDAIVVEGVRASLRTAQEVKRDEPEITDSIVADDIQKLPDFSITDALQRVTGVQITRDKGKGNKVTVRGLTLTETTLNGREIFSINDAEGFGRSFNFTAIAPELVSAIAVYKTSSARQIEGGVGGTVDIRTYHPFDFEGSKAAGAIKGSYGDLAEKTGLQLSALLSNRWETSEWGEFGILVDVSFQDRHYREDFKASGTPIVRDDIFPARSVLVSSGASEYINQGENQWTGTNLMLQWRPRFDLELYAESTYLNIETIEDTHQINLSVDGMTSFVPGSASLFSGTDDIERITWTDATMSSLSFIRDTQDQTKQSAIGGAWYGDQLILKADLSYTESVNDLVFFGPFLASTVASFSHDVGSTIPDTFVTGTDLLDPENYELTGLVYINRPFESDMFAAHLDADYIPSTGPFDSLATGLRYTNRYATNKPGQASAFEMGSITIPEAAAQGLIEPFPYDNYYPGSGSASIEDFLVSDLSNARDVSAYFEAFGITTPVSLSANPLSLWDMDEETVSGYFMASFDANDLPVDGNAGLRVVYTQASVAGFQTVPATGENEPLDIDRSYVDYLPSLNLRYDLGAGLYLRGAASKSMTRQKFSNLSPSLTLFQNLVNPALNIGSAGNPELEPVRSNNLDLALEMYFNPTTSLYLTGFTKRVDGFVTSVSSPEVHDGVTYQVTRPQNRGKADIKGFEVGYQQFYDFLPGWWRGLGLQANYTYIDSEDNTLISGETLPLQDLSKNSFNLIGMYELGKVSTRVAYNWRDDFLSGVTNVVGVGPIPIYTESYGWLDASVRYRINDQLILGIEGNNLLRTERSSNYSSERRPQRSVIDDRQITISLSSRF